MTNFKQGLEALKKAKRARRRKSVKSEAAAKLEVRERDKRCRFPKCGCTRNWDPMRSFLEVSHNRHKGMGGNPAGDRSAAALMVLLCKWRHQDGKVAYGRGTLRTAFLGDDGYNGAVAWEIPAELFSELVGLPTAGDWIEIAREQSPGVLLPSTEEQRVVLAELATMDV